MEVLAYIAAAVTGLWGAAHAIPTRQVLAGFAPITADNRRVLQQEWLAESLTMSIAEVNGDGHGAYTLGSLGGCCGLRW